MTSREIVIRTLEFSQPERLAMSLPAPYPNDICWGWTGGDPKCPPGSGWQQQADGNWLMKDEWGNTWGRLESISKGEVVKGALETWEMMDSHTWPDYSLPERYEPARKVFAENGDKFRILGIPGFPFAVARYMRRMEQFLADLLLDEGNVAKLLRKVESIIADSIVQAAAAGADAVMFAEDWGTQNRLLVHPRMWREIFKPGFQRLCKCAHENNLYVFMHSCGYIYDVIPDLIESGINVLQLDQPRLMGLERLADEFGGRVTFWSPVDIQATLQTRDAAIIEEDARLMVEKLGMGGRGGFIAGYYPSNEAIGLGAEWQDAACKAFVKCGSGH
ncbi:MAG TPA: uroporphyrinogen decarboxylase family protein, partial [Planctomycetota bacterium]|nr:uroporphyrinogen decarboxylase family protein [Planctomycetota bacterium]